MSRFYRKPTPKEIKAKDERDTKAILEKVKSEVAMVWEEDFTPPKQMQNEYVMFDGDSYDAWVKTLLPTHLQKNWNREVKMGELVFKFFKLPLVAEDVWCIGPITRRYGVKRSFISLGPRRGVCCFNREINIPQIVKPVSPVEVWMSLTPMEVLTQRPGLRKARGRVLVGGLGMGWFARRCCERRQVESVTVVEINPEIAKHFAFDHPKLKIKVGDVFKENTSGYDSVLLDVWDSYGDAECSPKLNKVMESHKNVWAWGNVTSGFPSGLW